MLAGIIRGSLRRPRLIGALGLLVLIWGAWSVGVQKLEVLPRTPVARATIEVEAPGLVAEQVEQLVTQPLENGLAGVRGVAHLRSRSIQGYSLITLDFQPDADPDRTRQAIADSLAQAQGALPAGIGAPHLSPLDAGGDEAVGIGFTSTRLTPMALHELVQWSVRPRLLAIPGVAAVRVFGGETRRIEVRARSGDLSDSDLNYVDIYDAVRRVTGVAGAGFIDTPAQRVLIAPHGQAITPDDISAGQIQIAGSAPVRISDVADVVEAPAPAFSDALIQGRPAVVISIATQYGANPRDVARAIDTALASLAPGLKDQGVEIHTDLDRPTSFVGAAVANVAWELLIGAVLAGLVLAVMLRDLRAALIAAVAAPLSLLAAAGVLHLIGLTLNIMTLGGLALALGLIVDDAALDVEHVVARLRDAERRGASHAAAVLAATIEVRAPVIYATILVVIGLAPVLLLRGPQGALLRPLAEMAMVALLVSVAVTLTVIPALCLLTLGHVRPAGPAHRLARLKATYAITLVRIGRRPWLLIGAAGLAVALAVAGLGGFRSEFLPRFHSGHLVLETEGPASTSLAAMRDYAVRLTRDLSSLPGVRLVSERTGRASTQGDAAGPEHARFDIQLRPGLDAAGQDATLRDIRRIAGAYPGFAGDVRPGPGEATPEAGAADPARVLVRVNGPDLDGVDQAAEQVAALLRRVPGARQVTVATTPRAPVVRADLDFQRLAIYGLSAADVLDTIQTAYAGRPAAQIFDQGRATEIAVTAEAKLRSDPEGVSELLLRSSTGVATPLKSVANVYLTDGRAEVDHDGGVRRQLLSVDVAGRPSAFIARAQQALQHTSLPAETYVDLVPPREGADLRPVLLRSTGAALAAMLVLVLVAYGDLRSAVLVLASAAFALVGAAIAVVALGGVLSLGVVIGLVALSGLAARNAIILVARLEDLMAAPAAVWSADLVRHAARERVVAIVTSAVLVSVALAPLAVRAGAPGHEVLGPMAIVVILGLASSTLLGLFVLPSLAFALWGEGGRIARPDRAPS